MTDDAFDRRTLALVVARTELRRTWRSLRSDHQLLLAGAVIFGLMYAVGGGVLGYLAGATLTDGGGPSLTALRPGSVAAVVFGTFIVAQRTVKKTGSLDAHEGVLTAVPAPTVAVGIVLSEFGRAALFLGGPVLGTLIGFGVGSADPLATAVVAIVLVAFAVFVILLGFVVGMGIKAAAMRSRSIANHRGVLGFVLSFGVAIVYVAIVNGEVARQVLSPLFATPIAWVPDLALAATPGASPAPYRVGGAAATLGLGLPALAVAAGRVAPMVWLGDSVRPDADADSAATAVGDAHPIDRVLPDRFPRTTAAVARKTLLRARRAPFTIQYAIVPFFFVFFYAVQGLLESGTLPGWLPLGVAVASAITTGAAFSLNPIGSEGDALPITLTAGFDGREFVAGLFAAGWLVGLPIAVALPLVTGLATGAAPPTILATVAIGVGLSIGAPGIAAGAGVHFPNFETQSVHGGRETVVPKGWAFGLFGLGVVGLGAPAWALQIRFVRNWLATTVGLAPGTVEFLGIAVGSLLVTVAGWLGYRHAAATLDSYWLPGDQF